MRGRGRPRPSARHLRPGVAGHGRFAGVRERTTRCPTRTPRWSEDNGVARGARRENEKDQRGQERNEYHRQAILVALQTGKTTRNSVSETRPLLAEDEFRSFCSARDSGAGLRRIACFVRRVPPAFWSSRAIYFRVWRIDARMIFFCVDRVQFSRLA